jgi:hypothetical protein
MEVEGARAAGLPVFSKGRVANLTHAQVNALAELTSTLTRSLKRQAS